MYRYFTELRRITGESMSYTRCLCAIVTYNVTVDVLRRITEESVVRDCKSIIVLFNSGIHDLFSSKKFSLHKYSVGLNHSMVELKGMFAGLEHRSRAMCSSNQTTTTTTTSSSLATRTRRIKLFWVSTVPLFSKYR